MSSQYAIAVSNNKVVVSKIGSDKVYKTITNYFVIDKNKLIAKKLDDTQVEGIMNSLDFIEPCGNNDYKYKGDTVSFKNSIGTLMFVNTVSKFYGVLVSSKNDLAIHWITFDDFEASEYKDSVCNINGSLIDITEYKSRVFKTNWGVGIAKSHRVSRDIVFKARVKDSFVKYVNAGMVIPSTDSLEELQKGTDSSNIVTDIAQITDGDTMENDDEHNGLVDDISKVGNQDILNLQQLLSNYNDKLSDVLVRLEGQEASLREKEEQADELQKKLKDSNDRLNRVLSRLDNTEFKETTETIIEVDNIYTFSDKNAKKEHNKNDFATEMVLKYLSDNDRVTIDKDYYTSKINAYLIKTLEQNLNLTKYTAITKLKFEADSEYCIYAVVEFDESSKQVVINVIKAYSKVKMSDSDIANCYRVYEENRKRYNTYRR